jgi:hypothetical protein
MFGGLGDALNLVNQLAGQGISAHPADNRSSPPTPPQEAGAGQQPEMIMQYFAYGHLPSNLQAVSKPFCDLAQAVVSQLPRNPERTVALRKLLEAKDCAVRALTSQ